MNKDIYFLKKTFTLACKAEGFTSPNPLVGAVIIKNNRIIAQGYHRKSGFPHAEIEAISRAKQNLKGSTLYINLEPCCHFGKTPPCVDEIIRKKIKKVVIATIDPNIKVRGKSIKILKKAGVKVRVGLLQDEAKKINEIFFKNMKKKLPFVAAKIAQSLDGKIATANGISKWITDKKTRLFARSLRDKYDCILVGVNTVIKDNPRLDGSRKIPFKVVIDSNLRIPLNSYILKENSDKLIIFASARNKKKRKKIPYPSRIFFIKEEKNHLPIKEILKVLYSLGIMSVFVEGGSETLGRFFDSNLVDKLYMFISPKIIGGKNSLTSIGAKGFLSPNDCPYIKGIEVKHLGEDILISGYPRYEKASKNI